MLDAVLTNRSRVEAASSLLAGGESSGAELAFLSLELDVVASALEVFVEVGRGAMRGRDLPARPVEQLLEFLRKVAFGRAAERRSCFQSISCSADSVPGSRDAVLGAMRPTPERHAIFLAVLSKASSELSRTDARRRFAHGARIVGELLMREVELERSAATALALHSTDCVCIAPWSRPVHENRCLEPLDYDRLLDGLVECTNYFVRAGSRNVRVQEPIARLRALRAETARRSKQLNRPGLANTRGLWPTGARTASELGSTAGGGESSLAPSEMFEFDVSIRARGYSPWNARFAAT